MLFKNIKLYPEKGDGGPEGATSQKGGRSGKE
jgi:hypothetical protein